MLVNTRGGLISERILTLVIFPKRSAKFLPWAENLKNCLKGGKFSAQGWDLATFLGQWDQSQNAFWEKATFTFY